MLKKLLSLLLIVCLLSTLVSCGSYNPIIPGEEIELEDVILVQVTNPESNILVLAGRDNGEAVMALGEKDENGMTEKITGVFYTTENEEGFFIELRNDGLPLSLVDTNGTEIIYSNYTDSTVEISIYDNKGNLIAGPTVVEIDPQKIKEIKELFQLYKSGARGWSEVTEIFKVIGIIGSTFTAAVIVMVGTVPAAVAAAGISLLLIVISAITSNDVDDMVSIGWGAVTCPLNPLSCIFPVFSILGEAIDIINQGGEGCTPILLSPLNGAALDNGCSDQSDLCTWNFDWSDCPNITRYHLYVRHYPTATIPAIDDENITNSNYIDERIAYVAEINRFGWKWKVRAMVNGQWGPWSKERYFDVEPLNTDCPFL